MPIIHVNVAEGRTVEQRAAAMAAITDAVVRTLDVRPEQVRVHVNEVKPENYSIGGKTLAVLMSAASEAAERDT